MFPAWKARKNQRWLTDSPASGGEERSRWGRVTCWPVVSDNRQLPTTSRDARGFFLTERSGNVYENKGTVLKAWGRSGNVHENKGTYPVEPGMLLKTQVVNARPSERSGHKETLCHCHRVLPEFTPWTVLGPLCGLCGEVSFGCGQWAALRN